jgi:tRNA U34 5-carboxymethylaminomethyl modifying enzyme MnmG/GidA
MSTEEKEVLSKSKPVTLGAAKRIPGVTPVAILELFRYSMKMQQALAKISAGEKRKQVEV